MTVSTFVELGVAEPICRALSAEAYETPTPIQVQAIPLLLAGKDLLGIAQTGSGKTCAFAVPLMQRLAADPRKAGPRGARALILAPTRELALQIFESCKVYGRHLGLRYAVIFGGVGQNPQVSALAGGVDVLVATPGRLLDLIGQRHIRLDKTTALVLDEADRMLDMGFIKDVRRIVAGIPKERQSLLFSATMPADIAKLAAEILHNPVRVDLAPKTMAVDSIDQRVFFVDAKGKRDLLVDLLDDAALSRVIVFTRTKHGANRVAEQLERAGVETEAIHGNKSQNARQRALERFREGRARVLVATDIAARGIDVAEISHVINYELPNIAESYVHRIGRTARAGATGIAIAFCDSSERAYLRDIERLMKRNLAVVARDQIARTASRRLVEERPSSRPLAERSGERSQERPGGQGAGKFHGKPYGKPGAKSHGRPHGNQGSGQARREGASESENQGRSQGHPGASHPQRNGDVTGLTPPSRGQRMRRRPRRAA